MEEGRLKSDEIWDCIILGAGPAGLSALTYLVRFHRSALALGGAGPKPRCSLIDRTYNLPGYPDGVTGVNLLKRLRDQAEEFGGEVWSQTAEDVSGNNGDFHVELSDGQTLRARKIILAMGVRDRAPSLEALREHEGHFLRYCPVCDGYEHTGRQLGIIGSGGSVARHALFLKTFSNDISIFLDGRDANFGRYEKILRDKEISYHQPRIVDVMIDDDPAAEYRGAGVCLEDGSAHPLGVLYSNLGCDLHFEPVRGLNLKLDEDKYILTDINQETSVPGIYAAGDVTSQINQISVAFGQAAIAAVRVHNSLDD